MIKRFLLLILLTIVFNCSASSEDSNNTVIRISFAGDCTLGQNYNWTKDSRAFCNVIAHKGYDYPFSKVREIFEADDFTIVNLEGVLQNDNKGRLDGRKYNFRGNTEYTEILKKGSIEGVCLGNNHSSDFGSCGKLSTQTALDNAGIQWALNEDPIIIDKGSIRIAVVSYMSNQFAKIRQQFPEIVRHLKEEKNCHCVVLCLHIGTEYDFTHDSSQSREARYAIDCGADAVIMHHAHVLQGMSIYKGRNILYSLGNFVFGGNRHITSSQQDSLIAVLEFHFSEHNYTGQRLILYPCKNTAPGSSNSYQPYPVFENESDRILHLLQADTDYPLLSDASENGIVQNLIPAE